MSEVKELFDSLNKAFEDFKSANDERLAQIEKTGKADPLIEEKVDKANNQVADLESKLQEAQAKIDKLDLDFQQQGMGANSKPDQRELKNEAKEFFVSMKGRPVEDAEVDRKSVV